MKALRRVTVALVVLMMLLCTAAARAQGLKQLPANPIVVIKMNNPQGISEKLAAWSQKLGLANFDPAFGDPLGALKKQLNIKDGLDGKGEIIVGVYESQPGDEPLVVALLPVSDYKTFLGNLANLKTEGELSSFTLPDEQEPFYAVNWGSFAAITPTKELLVKKPEGVEVSQAASKQLDGNDVTIWANMKLISSRALPQFKAGRQQLVTEMEGELKRNPQMNQKYLPVIKALVNTLFNGVEGFLTDSQSATFGVNIKTEGITSSLQAEFSPESGWGKTVASFKNTDAALTSGMPNRKYFAFGGAIMDPKVTANVLENILGPVQKELNAAGDEAKGLAVTLENFKEAFKTIERFSFGYVQPTAIGQQSMIQAVAVYEGDAKKIAVAEREYMKGSAEMMKMMPQAPGMQMSMDLKEGAKTVDGVTLDHFVMRFTFDKNSPEAAQAQQMINMFYGANGLNAYMGAVDDRKYLMTMGGDDALLSEAIASVKKNDDTLSQTDMVKAISAQLPQQRAIVYYIQVDNIATTVLDFMGQMGFKIPLRLPEMSPVGITMASEGPVLRFDTAVSADMVEKLVSAGMQAAMMMQNPGGRRGGL